MDVSKGGSAPPPPSSNPAQPSALVRVPRKAHDQARTIPKLYRLAVGRLSGLPYGLLVVGTLDDVGGRRMMTIAISVINAILGMPALPAAFVSGEVRSRQLVWVDR